MATPVCQNCQRILRTIPEKIKSIYFIPPLYTHTVRHTSNDASHDPLHDVYVEPAWRRRERQGKARNVSRYGPLIDLPDYSYVDGRPVEMTPRQAMKLEQRTQLTTRIMELLGDLDRAKHNHQRKTEDDQNQRDDVLRQKLKPKLPPI